MQKLFPFLQSYFKDSWNTFDFVTVVGSIVDALMVEFAVSKKHPFFTLDSTISCSSCSFIIWWWWAFPGLHFPAAVAPRCCSLAGSRMFTFLPSSKEYHLLLLLCHHTNFRKQPIVLSGRYMQYASNASLHSMVYTKGLEKFTSSHTGPKTNSLPRNSLEFEVWNRRIWWKKCSQKQTLRRSLIFRAPLAFALIFSRPSGARARAHSKNERRSC